MAVTAVILFLCLIRLSDAQREPLFPNSDKFIHLGMHFTLCATILFDFYRMRFYEGSVKRTAFFTFLYSFLLGLIIEILQDLMKLGRSFDWLDLLANSTGAAIGSYLAGKYFGKRMIG